MKQIAYFLGVFACCLTLTACNKKPETSCACGPSCQCDAKTKHVSCLCARCECTGE